MKEDVWEEPLPKKKHSMQWLTGTVILIVIYVLSTGPAALLERKGKLTTSNLETFYLPLIALCEAARPVNQFMNWYVRLWTRLPDGKIKNHP